MFRSDKIFLFIRPYIRRSVSLNPKNKRNTDISNLLLVDSLKDTTSCSCGFIRHFSEKTKPNFDNFKEEINSDPQQKEFDVEVNQGSKSFASTGQQPDDDDGKTDVDLVRKDDDVNDDDAEDSYDSALLDYYIKKAKDDLDYMDDVDYHDIQDVNHRVFFKIVDIWLKEVGPAKRGYRDFVVALLHSLEKFNIEGEVSAYLRLLDCFPHGKHTEIKRIHWFKAAFQDKFADHALGVDIFRKIFYNAVPNGEVFTKATDLFGRYSPATSAARGIIFWHPRMVAADPHPVTRSELKQLTPIEIAFRGLRQMNPGIDSHYHNFTVDKSRCDETLKANQIDSIISVQTDEQISLFSKHDPATPVYVEGPYLTYFKSKSIRYFVMRSDPAVKKSNERTQILTTQEWWTQFYKTEWTKSETSVSTVEESFFPIVDVVDPTERKKDEIAIVEPHVKAVEGTVYAIACTDYNSPEALLTWIRGLVPQNPILSECTVLMREEEAFLLNAPKSDPNDSLYDDIELPVNYYEN